MPSSLTASDLFAAANGGINAGNEECYWCASKATRMWRHGELEPSPSTFVRRTSLARRPSSNYLCFGCWRLGWKRVTMPFLAGGFKDGQCAENHNLWVTEEGVWGIRLNNIVDSAALYPLLLKPPLRFALILQDGAVKNHLGLCVANDFVQGIKAETVLQFTVNHVRFEYTPYELEEGLRTGPQGKSPGVQELIRLLGKFELPPKENARPEKMERGRPKPLEDGRQLLKVVAGRSGG